MTTTQRLKHLLTLEELTAEGLTELLELAKAVKASPATYAQTLAGKKVALLFEKASTRTRISFEVGVVELGGYPVVLNGSDMQIGRGESLSDTIQVMSRYVDALMIRTFAHETVETLAAHGTIPIINGLTDLHHPCQVLADLLTIEEHFGQRQGKILAYVGDGNNMAHSLLLGGALSGMTVRICSPAAYAPDQTIIDQAKVLAQKSGGRIEQYTDPVQAVAGADVIYSDVFASMGQEEESADRLKAFQGYHVNQALLMTAADDVIFLHCLPAHRGEEVTAEVIDGSHSLVFDQAENRLHAQKALMIELIGVMD